MPRRRILLLVGISLVTKGLSGQYQMGPRPDWLLRVPQFVLRMKFRPRDRVRFGAFLVFGDMRSPSITTRFLSLLLGALMVASPSLGFAAQGAAASRQHRV